MMMLSSASISGMSCAQRSACLEEDGFFVWPGLVACDIVDAHVAAHEAWLDERGRLAPEEWAGLPRAEQVDVFIGDYKWHESSSTALEVFYRPELIEFLAGHFGVEPALRAPQTGQRHRGASIHADGFGAPVDPPGAEVRMWVALEDIDPASGPIYMIPGSHLIMQAVRDRIRRECPDVLVRASQAAVGHEARREVPAAYVEMGHHTERCWTVEVKERRLPRVVPSLLKGDTVIFRTDVAHGTMPCLDETLTRRHALAFFAARTARWYREHAWFGPDRDLRSERTRLPSTIDRNARGLYVTNWLRA